MSVSVFDFSAKGSGSLFTPSSSFLDQPTYPLPDPKYRLFRTLRALLKGPLGGESMVVEEQ